MLSISSLGISSNFKFVKRFINSYKYLLSYFEKLFFGFLSVIIEFKQFNSNIISLNIFSNIILLSYSSDFNISSKSSFLVSNIFIKFIISFLFSLDI